MKKQIIEQEVINDLIHKLEYALKCATVGNNENLTTGIKNLIKELSYTYKYEESENKYLNIPIEERTASEKAHVWLIMGMMDFEKHTQIWVPKVFKICETIDNLRSCTSGK